MKVLVTITESHGELCRDLERLSDPRSRAERLRTLASAALLGSHPPPHPHSDALPSTASHLGGVQNDSRDDGPDLLALNDEIV